MNFIYAGTPEFAVEPLKQLIAAGMVPSYVITQPDKPQGRKGILTPPPIKTFALQHEIPVLQYAKIRDHVPELQKLGADILITCAYGQILTEELLHVFSKGVYNIHASLLPRYRGASPIQWAVLNGDAETGITIMQTDVGLDTGDILLQKTLKINDDTAEELSQRLSVLGGEAIVEALQQLDTLARVPQNDALASTVKKIEKQDAKLDFTWSASKVVRWIRGMNPSPVAFAYWNDTTVNFYNAEMFAYCGDECPGTVLFNMAKPGLVIKCGTDAVRITQLQLSGGKRMRAQDFLNGRKMTKGQLLQ